MTEAAEELVDFTVAQREGDPPGAVASFPFDRMTVERFRAAFPRARWREELGAWFVPGARAGRRLAAWKGREWTGVLAFADQRGRDAFSFDPINSSYLEVGDDLVVRTPFSRAVIAVLRTVPWARWDPAAKAWRVPFRSWEALRGAWPAIEAAARDAEPAARRQRAAERRAAGGDGPAEAAERRRHRYPVPEDATPPLGRPVMTHAGPVVFEAVTGELVEPELGSRFYPAVSAAGAALIWAGWRRPTHAELVATWPARTPPAPAERARGWWQPTLEVLREERRRAASLDRARVTRAAKAAEPPP